MNDIEAAAEALLLAYERCHHLGSYIDALRSALAHAARGEGERIEEAHRALGKPGRIDDDGCCVGCGRSVQPSSCCPDYPVWPGPCRMCYSDPTPPPATGEAGTRGEVEKAVPLCEAPAGIFRTLDGNYGFKTEYHRPDMSIEAYCLDSGEAWWGEAPQSVARQRSQLVVPVDYRALPEAREGGRG